MNKERAKSADAIQSNVKKVKNLSDGIRGGGVFKIECRDSEGKIKWVSQSHNLVVNVGLQDMNDKYFSGSAYTATWFLGLYGSGATNDPAAGDTAASHAGWVEVTAYSQATRPICTFGSATAADPSVIDNTGSPAAFSINGTSVIGGAFLISESTKGGTTGILFSAADFQAPGDRSVVSGDTLNVNYTFNLDAV